MNAIGKLIEALQPPHLLDEWKEFEIFFTEKDAKRLLTELAAKDAVVEAAREVTLYNSEYMVRISISKLAAALAKLKKHGKS